LTTTSESVSQKFKAEAPSATAGKAGASGGGFTYDGQLLGGGSINIFYVFGAVLLVTAVLFVALIKPPRWGTAGSFAAGAAVFVGIGVTIDKYPWIWLAGVGVLFALFLFWVIKARMNTKVMAAEATRAYALDTTLSTMVKAIHTAPSDTKNAIKDRIRTTATGSDQRVVEATISKIKARENL